MSANRIACCACMAASLSVTAAAAAGPGESSDKLGPYHYAVQDLGNFGGVIASGYAINIHGQVVGEIYRPGGGETAFATGPYGQEVHTFAPDGFRVVFAKAINSIGGVAGSACEISYPTCHAFAIGRKREKVRWLDELGWSNATAINASGQVAGWYEVPYEDRTHAFVTGPLAKGMVEITGIANATSRAKAMNDRGQVVGDYRTIDKQPRSFITDETGKMRDLGVFLSEAWGVNATGQVVGREGTRAFITGPDGKGVRHLDPNADADMAQLFSVNAEGRAVGNESGNLNGGEFTVAAVVTNRKATRMYRLDTLAKMPEGVTSTVAFSINDRGQIVVNGSDGHVYLLTPVKDLD